MKSAKGSRGGGGGGGKDNFSESDSDWDTTAADVPAQGRGGKDDKTDISDNDEDDDDLPVQPKPKTHSSLPDKGKEDKAGDGAPHSSRGEKSGPPSASAANRRNLKTPASASAVRLSPFDSDSRETSPVPPPFNFSFDDEATKNSGNKTKKSSPSSAVKNQKKSRYDMSPTPKAPTSMEVSIPQWDDSDAEQRTLQQLHTTLKKEKTRESANKAAREQIQEGGDNSQALDHSLSVAAEQLGQGMEEKTAGEMQQQGESVKAEKQKKEKRNFLASWLGKDAVGPNSAALEENSPYQPFIVKNSDGKRFMYCFSEGSTAFFEVVEEESEAVMPKIADRVEGYVKRGWQEFFGLLRILTSLVVLLAVEASTFLTDHIARPVLLGLLLTTGNRLVKPLLAGVFNLLVQPVVIFLWNVLSGVRHTSQPVVDIFGGVMTKLAVFLQAFRLVEVNLAGSHRPSQRVLRLEGGGGGEVV